MSGAPVKTLPCRPSLRNLRPPPLTLEAAIMSLPHFYRTLWKGKRGTGEVPDTERDCCLRVYLNDTRCELILTDSRREDVGRFERLAETGTEPQALLSAAILALPPDAEMQIGNVEV